jgi:hypothetical protein
MILFRLCHYTVSQPTNYKLDMFVTWEQNFVNLMTQHKIEEICNVNNTMSLKLEVLLEEPSAIFVESLGQ